MPAAGLTLPERKRLETARALATQPRLLLLDEVMAGLRPTEIDTMVAIFRALVRETGLTINAPPGAVNPALRVFYFTISPFMQIRAALPEGVYLASCGAAFSSRGCRYLVRVNCASIEVVW